MPNTSTTKLNREGTHIGVKTFDIGADGDNSYEEFMQCEICEDFKPVDEITQRSEHTYCSDSKCAEKAEHLIAIEEHEYNQE